MEASGAGTVYSNTQVHVREESYVLALVMLSEGPPLMTNILAPDSAQIQIGQAVRFQFVPSTGDDPIPCFVPA